MVITYHFVDVWLSTPQGLFSAISGHLLVSSFMSSGLFSSQVWVHLMQGYDALKEDRHVES